MRVRDITIFGTLAAAILAKSHRYGHRHAHGIVRNALPNIVTSYAAAATETVILYELDGHVISEEEVRQGIANGTLLWGSDGVLSTSTRQAVALATSKPSPSSSQVPMAPSQAIETNQTPSLQGSSPSGKFLSATPLPSPSKPESSLGSVATPQTASDLVDATGHCASCDTVFPNGKIPCSEFPYGYGALPIDHEGLGGWSGIQDPQYRGSDGYNDITTVPKGSCQDGSCCKPGSFCSYGCPNPYLKLSFPKRQGKTKQSVGGLYCNEYGFLEMADGSLGKTLCGKDSDKMKVKVQNQLSKSVSICRTDYPGTESMTFPLTVGPGETKYLANPDQSRYYFWNDMPTSAHYYVNKQGVPEAEACTWGQEGQGKGNWSPTILGTSFDDMRMNRGFTGLVQNELCKSEKLGYSITFTGDGVTSPCRYVASKDQYCEGDECHSNKMQGCTASVATGSTLLIILHND